MAFPCNQFGKQEPGTNEEIKKFVAQFGVEFPLFEKSNVNGEASRPVFAWLKERLTGSFGNAIKWNFTKFLIDREGKPIKRYGPKDAPMSFEDEIKQLLNEKAKM